jgi:hypothetical protein
MTDTSPDTRTELAALFSEAQLAIRGWLPRGYDTIVELRPDRIELTLLGRQSTDRLRSAYLLDERLRSRGLCMRLDEGRPRPPAEVLADRGANTVVTIERQDT